MPKNRPLDLADWEVTTKLPSGAIMNVTIRATTLDHRDHAIVLLDTLGRSLFSAPASSSVVRRISDEDRKAMQEARAEAAQVAASAGDAEPAPLPQRAARAKTR